MRNDTKSKKEDGSMNQNSNSIEEKKDERLRAILKQAVIYHDSINNLDLPILFENVADFDKFVDKCHYRIINVIEGETKTKAFQRSEPDIPADEVNDILTKICNRVRGFLARGENFVLCKEYVYKTASKEVLNIYKVRKIEQVKFEKYKTEVTKSERITTSSCDITNNDSGVFQSFINKINSHPTVQYKKKTDLDILHLLTENHTRTEIATTLGITNGCLRKRISRLFQFLKNERLSC